MNKRIKYLSLFSGIGGFESGLMNVVGKDNVELVAYSEIDKFASKAYSALYNITETKNLGDITKIDETRLGQDIDLITYGFPCQDISIAGNQEGFDKDSGTRSGLVWDALRVVEGVKPKVAIAENVRNLLSKSFEPNFKEILRVLDYIGYNNYWHVLETDEFGLPQGRKRVYIVSIRKDVDNGSFQFPNPIPLETTMQDLLEPRESLEPRRYLREEYLIDFLLNDSTKVNRRGRVLSNFNRPKRDVANTITTREPSRGMTQNYVIYHDKEERPSNHEYTYDNVVEDVKNGNFDIRDLTTLECFRLQGFTDEQHQTLVDAGISMTQRYNQAGNAVSVSVVEHLMREVVKVLNKGEQNE